MQNVNTYIISLEGKDIINSQKNPKGYITNNNKKLFKGSLDYSKESIKISEINDKLFSIIDKKQYTNAVVNVTFKYGNSNKTIDLDLDKNSNIDTNRCSKISVKCKRENGKLVDDSYIAKGTFQHRDMNTKEIRAELYRNGFKLDGKQYIRFKRSGGASRVGKCLFIRKDLYKKIMDWSRMGLTYGKNDKMDLASMEAYLALTTSSIIDIIDIDPKSILVIDDYESKFKDMVMATEWDDKNSKLKTSPKKAEVSNSIWDGQSLLDNSVFGEKYKDKGFLLLRNRYFKSAAFNTNIQRYFKDNNITEISQLNGFTLAERVEDIKLITTPSSIKYLKFKTHKRFNNDKKQCLTYWLENTEREFGIVKYEKAPTNLHEMVNTHYQLINTLPLSMEEVRKLLQPTLNYIELLKNDLSVLRNHIGINVKKTELWDIENEASFDFTNSDEMVYKLLMINDKFADTKMFRKYKNNLIEAYKNNIRKGHILINGNYSVLFGNGYEMLQHSCGKFNGNSILGVNEVNNKSFDYNKELIGIRSPHVTMGNVWCCTNRHNDILDNYFNSSPFIVHVNSINNNLLETLSGADFDSDSILLSDNKILVGSAKKIYGKYLVPTDFTPKKTTNRTNSIEDKIDLDIKTSKNLIGEIINLSQILNSEYWDRMKSGKSVEGLYEIICQLDVMSCIEIDKAKKESIVDAEKELRLIRESEFITYGNITRDKKSKRAMCRPYFFKFVGEGKNYKFVKKNTPMDYLEQIIDKEIPRIKDNKSVVNFIDLLIDKENINPDWCQINKILNKINKLNNELNGIWASNMIYDEKIFYTNIKKNKTQEYISKLNIKEESLLNILYRINNDYNKENGDIRKSGLLLLNVLFSTHTESFINLFKVNSDNICVLEMVESINDGIDNMVKIYEKTYKKRHLGKC